MLIVGTLRIQLPPGFEQRAPHVARLVARALATLPASRSVAELRVPPVRIRAGAPDAEVARSVAAAVAGALRVARAAKEDGC